MNLGDKMNFKKWFNEMASFSLPNNAQFSIPCSAVKIKLPREVQEKFPCQDLPVTMIDFRFEGPPAYLPPFNGFNNGSKFIAKLPESSEFLVYHGSFFREPEILVASQAQKLGYPQVPDDWFVRAELFGPNDQVIKPALGDFTGERKAYMTGGGK
jgi:hypothetical protein